MKDDREDEVLAGIFAAVSTQLPRVIVAIMVTILQKAMHSSQYIVDKRPHIFESMIIVIS